MASRNLYRDLYSDRSVLSNLLGVLLFLNRGARTIQGRSLEAHALGILTRDGGQDSRGGGGGVRGTKLLLSQTLAFPF